jgi:hypothetical protein
VPPGQLWGDLITNSLTRDGKLEPPRVAINSTLQENFILLDADPGYIDRIRSSASDPAQVKAWVEGSWDIISGGMFDDLWEPSCHVVSDFPSLQSIPRGWKLTRSYDHGQSKPFSVGFWAQSNGEPIESTTGRKLGQIPGDLFRIGEWYGCGSEPNTGLRMRASDIARGILERECDMGLSGRFRPGPADSSIFDKDSIDNMYSVADEFHRCGVTWMPCDKSSGSRKLGWQAVRQYLANAMGDENGFREAPGLFILPHCSAFQQLLPVLPRSDKDPDDADTESEDHLADEVRYRVRWQLQEASSGAWK